MFATLVRKRLAAAVAAADVGVGAGVGVGVGTYCVTPPLLHTPLSYCSLLFSHLRRW